MRASVGSRGPQILNAPLDGCLTVSTFPCATSVAVSHVNAALPNDNTYSFTASLRVFLITSRLLVALRNFHLLPVSSGPVSRFLQVCWSKLGARPLTSQRPRLLLYACTADTMERQLGEENMCLSPGTTPECLKPHVVANKTVLTVLIICNQSIFIIATPTDPTDPDVIDNFWLPSTVLEGPRTMSRLRQEARLLAIAWTGLSQWDIWAKDEVLMKADMQYPLTPPTGYSTGALHNTVFMEVDVSQKASRRMDRLAISPHPDLLDAALEDDGFQFRFSWLSKKDLRASLSNDMEVMHPIRKVFGLEPKAPAAAIEYRMCKFHPDTLTIGGKGCQKCATRHNRFRG